MLGPFTFTFTLESEEFEKFEKVATAAAADLYQTLINTRAPDGANKRILFPDSGGMFLTLISWPHTGQQTLGMDTQQVVTELTLGSDMFDMFFGSPTVGWNAHYFGFVRQFSNSICETIQHRCQEQERLLCESHTCPLL